VADEPAARLTTAMPRITGCGMPISPSSAATAPVALMVRCRPQAASTSFASS
jgi:hypothetical protein